MARGAGDGQAALLPYGFGLTYDDVPEPEPEPSSCRVTYTTNDWVNGFTASVSVTNTGTTAIDPWRLQWSFSAGQRVTQSWSARVIPSAPT
jgi:beta-glucosidase